MCNSILFLQTGEKEKPIASTSQSKRKKSKKQHKRNQNKTAKDETTSTANDETSNETPLSELGASNEPMEKIMKKYENLKVKTQELQNDFENASSLIATSVGDTDPDTGNNANF